MMGSCESGNKTSCSIKSERISSLAEKILVSTGLRPT